MFFYWTYVFCFARGVLFRRASINTRFYLFTRGEILIPGFILLNYIICFTPSLSVCINYIFRISILLDLLLFLMNLDDPAGPFRILFNSCGSFRTRYFKLHHGFQISWEFVNPKMYQRKKISLMYTKTLKLRFKVIITINFSVKLS